MKPLLNAVKSFAPADLLVDVKYEDGRKEKYLPINARVMWALVWAKEKGQEILIDDKDVSYDPTSKQLVSKCCIWILDKEGNGKRLVSTAVAGKYFDPDHMQTKTPVQDVCTMAKGRALSNMGFATAACGFVPEPRQDAAPFAYNFREVKDFDPANYLIDIVDPATTETHKYMEVKYRLLWALLWATANKKKLIFDEFIVGYDPASRIYTCGCDIKDEMGRVIASGVAGRYYDPLVNISDTPIQTACTAAKGRALANLGFGTFYGSVEEGDTSTPCDAGVPVMENNPFMILASGGQINTRTTDVNQTVQPNGGTEANPASMQPEAKSHPTEDTNDPPESIPTPQRIPLSLEEALSYKLEAGKFAGKTVGELNVTDEGRKYLKYWTNPRYGSKNRMLYSAAMTVAENFKL